jgi:probable HAF family extracellular repeat protein
MNLQFSHTEQAALQCVRSHQRLKGQYGVLTSHSDGNRHAPRRPPCHTDHDVKRGNTGEDEMLIHTTKLFVSAMIGLSCLTAAATPPVYRIEELGGLPTGTGGSSGSSINDEGVVVGHAYLTFDHYPTWIATMWKPGTGVQAIGALSANHERSIATGINTKGQVVGSIGVDEGQTEAFIWSEAEGMRRLGFLTDDHRRSGANAVNALGQVAGYSGAGDRGLLHAVVWDQAGNITDLGAWSDRPNLSLSVAYAIDDAGRVVGYSKTNKKTIRAFSWTSAQGMQKLRSLAKDSVSVAYGVNDQGDTVGYDVHDFDNYRVDGVVWMASGKVRALARVNQDDFGDRPLAINTHGVVVGYASQPTGALAALWESSGTGHLLKDLVDPNDPLKDRAFLQYGAAINGRGEIVANGTLDGQPKAFKLVPQ